MKNKVKKVIAITIGLSVMSGSIVPVFATDTAITSESTINGQSIVSQKKLLTLKAAVDAAIENSDKLSLKSKEIKLYRNKLQLQEKLDKVNPDPIDSDFPYDKLDLQKDQTRQQKDFLEDQIESDITNKYNDLVSREIEINKLKKSIEIKSKDFDSIKLKKEIGLVTDVDVKSLEIEIQTLKNNEKAKEDLLKVKKEYFEVLTDLKMDEHNLNHNIEYTPFKIDGSVDNYIDEKIDEYLKYNYEILKLTSDYIDDMEDDGLDEEPEEKEEPDKSSSKYYDTIDDQLVFNSEKYKEDVASYIKSYSTELSTYGSYLETKYNVESGEVTLDSTRNSLKNGLKESYSSLLDLENQISMTKQQIDLSNKKLGYAKLQWDLGLITKNEYDSQELKSQDLDTGLRNLVNNYNTLKNNIQKPWLLSSGSSTGV